MARILPTCAIGSGRTDLRVLVLNTGSSSLKASVVGSADDTVLAQTEASLGPDATRSGGLKRPVQEALRALAATVPTGTIEAVGYRVVHGGQRFSGPVRVNERVLTAIEALRAFAPLHNHLAVQTMRAGRAWLPRLP